MNHRIDIDWAVERGEAPADANLEGWMSAALDRHLETGTTVDVRVVDSEEMRQLNRDYRGKDRPTNVLSFPADLHPAVTFPLLGDLVVCAEVVAREAVEQGKSLSDHWAHLVIHGTLHLLGFDHIQEADAQRMEDEERSLLAGFGIADPYQ